MCAWTKYAALVTVQHVLRVEKYHVVEEYKNNEYTSTENLCIHFLFRE